MKLTTVGSIRRDCTYKYDVKLNDYSIRYFIKEVLKRKKEYGTIYINNESIEYEYGRLLHSIDKFNNLKINKISAEGGYTLMNYNIITDNE